MARFKLDEEQTEAIFELKLYRLARLKFCLFSKSFSKNVWKQTASNRYSVVNLVAGISYD